MNKKPWSKSHVLNISPKETSKIPGATYDLMKADHKNFYTEESWSTGAEPDVVWDGYDKAELSQAMLAKHNDVIFLVVGFEVVP